LNSQEPLVELRNVTYTHWNQTEPTLRNVSLQIQRGTLTVLVGPSGSGKTTVCDLFNGVIPHLHGGKMEGEVWIDGVETRLAEVKDLAPKVGRVFQDAETMFTTLYVEDEIAFGPENLCVKVEDIRRTVEDLLELTDLTLHRHNLVWNLSGGQVQKLGLAAVLAMRPQLIVLDEPTANLDPVATHSVHELLIDLRREGVTVLLVTRELDEFLAQADQLVLLDQGQVIAAGAPRQMLADLGEKMVRQLGVWLPETAEIGIALQQAGRLQGQPIPITVEETGRALIRAGCFPELHIPNDQAPAEQMNAALTGNDSAPLISARSLVYTYPGMNPALDGVSLDIHAGELLAIVGRNGAGKSTLAKLLVGLLKPQGGELTLFGKPARHWKVSQLANQAALVLQNPEHQFLTDSVREEIEYSLLAQGISEPSQVNQAVEETLGMLGLSHVQGIHPFALSAGLKRRLGVATMLVGHPKVLLVDEPTYGQDKQMTRTLMALMSQIRQRGIALVMITHDMRLVQEYAERVVVMSTGRVLYDGTFAGLFSKGSLLQQANLRPTILHELIDHLNIHYLGEELRSLNAFLDCAGLPIVEEYGS
jgi:energy-coupling factor transport system ATP-binding protein